MPADAPTHNGADNKFLSGLTGIDNAVSHIYGI